MYVPKSTFVGRDSVFVPIRPKMIDSLILTSNKSLDGFSVVTEI